MPSTLRITGLATGLDVDNMVKQLMQAEKTKVDKVKQDRQLIQWRQDLYREIIGDLNTFKSTYFDVLNKDKYILSQNSLSPYSVNTVSGTSVSATATTSVIQGTYEIEVSELATGAKVQSTNTTKININDIIDNNLNQPATIKINVNNGSVVEITYDSTTTYKQLLDKINTNSQLSGSVRAYYSEVTGKITIETTKTGENAKIQITEENSTKLQELGLITGTEVSGKNAKFKIIIPGETNSVEITDKQNNTFSLDGITYSLKEVGTTKFSVVINSQPSIDKIKDFINKYNEIIDKINSKLTEKRAYSYKPLTDDQKKDMKEDEIKKWEEKAKEGLLKGDSILQNIVYNMRQAFFESVKDVGISLQEIGLSTSSDYTQKGKIIIDESKLKRALEVRPQDVLNLLTKTSSTAYDPNSTYQGRTTRNSENGIFQRLKDILEDNIRTTRNSNGKKGVLLEKAGIKGDFSEFNNLLTNELKQKDRVINDLNDKLFDKENKYYQQFAKLEKAMQKYNDQSAWLSSQLGAMFK